jgi:hypothetical protein
MQDNVLTRSQYSKQIHVIAQTGTLYSELGNMVVETFRKMSFSSELIQHEDISNIDADVLLFICDIVYLEKYEAQVRNFSRKKPVTAFWFLEPFGPDCLKDSALKIASILARCDWPDILTENLPSVKKLIPSRPPGRKPHNNFILSALRFILSNSLRKRITHSLGYECPNLDSRDMYYMSLRYELFRRNFQRPWIDLVLVGTHSKQRLLKKADINATMVRLGHHPGWGYDMSLERDVDVVFLGHIHRKKGRRADVLKSVKERLGANGYELMIVNKGCFGRERTRLLNRAKILLDVVRMPWEIPGIRLLMAMSCGAMVISTGFRGDPAPYKLNTHLVDADPEQLAETVIRYLKNDSERCKIAKQAQRFVTEQLTLQSSLQTILNTVAGRRQQNVCTL